MPDEKKQGGMLDFDMGDFDLSVDMSEPSATPMEARDIKELGLERAREIIGYSEEPPVSPDVVQSVEDDMNAGVLTVMSHIQKQAAVAQERAKANIQTSYFATIVFLDHAQLVAFMQASGFEQFGNPDIDGIALAESMGIALPPSAYDPRELKGDAKLSGLALGVDDPLFG